MRQASCLFGVVADGVHLVKSSETTTRQTFHGVSSHHRNTVSVQPLQMGVSEPQTRLERIEPLVP